MDRTMKPLTHSLELRAYRNSRLYRSLMRTLRVYNRQLVTRLREAGFTDFSPAYPALLSNLDLEGTTIGVLALRAGVTRQGAGQLLREIERCGYVEMRDVPHDGRATLVRFTTRGRRLLATVKMLVDEIEADFAANLAPGLFEQVRDGLLQIADRIDPDGALGSVDRPPTAPAPDRAGRRAAPRKQRP